MYECIAIAIDKIMHIYLQALDWGRRSDDIRDFDDL